MSHTDQSLRWLVRRMHIRAGIQAVHCRTTIHSQMKNGSRILQAKLVRSRLTVFIWLESVISLLCAEAADKAVW